MILSGWADKLFWRYKHGDGYHCFKKLDQSGGHQNRSAPGFGIVNAWVSLCGRATIYKKIGGQSIDRPRVEQRCGLCDGLEMHRRGWNESGPETVRRLSGSGTTRSSISKQ